MPTFKNIRVPIGKSGKTRLQRVQVLKSGKFKFVKNLKKIGKRSSKRVRNQKLRRRRSTPKRNVRKTAKGKMFRTVGATGALEDVAWGFMGFQMLGGNVTALPTTRVIQGLQGIALNRRGKSRLVPGILDLLSIYLAGGYGGGSILAPITNLLKLRPL